jgi:hypothetical protein
MLLFGGALLMAAVDEPPTCRIQYRYTAGNNAEAMCFGYCPGATCKFNVWVQGPYLCYSCSCPNDTAAECNGVVIVSQTGIGGGCVLLYAPCGAGSRGECIGMSNPYPIFMDACACVMP